jgi:hypothetical protein
MNTKEVERLINSMTEKELRKAMLALNSLDLEEYPMTRGDFNVEIRQALSPLKTT